MIRKNGRNKIMPEIKFKKIIHTWPKVSKDLYVPHTKIEYEHLRGQLDELIDEVGNNENHPLASYMEMIGVLILDYEKEYHPMPESNGINALKYLMKERGLNQSDLIEIGTQGVVSEILNGKRELNIRQIKELSKKFSVSPAVFI